jgi:hypothetical protein
MGGPQVLRLATVEEQGLVGVAPLLRLGEVKRRNMWQRPIHTKVKINTYKYANQGCAIRLLLKKVIAHL